MKRFKNILCVVEAGEVGRPALKRAVKLAENNQASLTVIDVIPRVTVSMGMPEGGPTSADLQAAMVSVHEKQLKTLVAAYRSRLDVQTGVLAGVPFLEIIREVLRNGRDLVIKTPDTADWMSRLFGSDDMHLLRKCPCPVWLIKSEASKSYRCIMAAVDVDDNYPPAEQETRQSMNRKILQIASSLALSEFAELHVVHAWNAPGESIMISGFMNMPEDQITTYIDQVRQQHEQTMNALMGEVTTRLGKEALDYLKPQIHLLKGWAHKEIPAQAQQIEADLVVMGTMARTGIPGFIMGNTAETILNQIDCSVLAIKPPGFVTPVTLKD